MPLPNVLSSLGYSLWSGERLMKAFLNGFSSYTDGIVAAAGGGQTNAVKLSTASNRVITVATANDSVALPPSSPGQQISVTNSGANSLQVFSSLTSSIPAGTLDTINGTAGATGVAVANGKTAVFTCFTAGAWIGPVALA